MKNKKRSILRSSSSSDDDKPLASSSHNGVNGGRSRHMASLLEYSRTVCDFCDDISYNKYNMLIHNAKHIIIPLLSIKIPQCPVCMKCFETEESLEHHTTTEHQRIPEHRAKTEHQPIPEHRTKTEHQAIPEHRTKTEHQAIPEHRTKTEHQAIPELRTKTEHQPIPEHWPKTEHSNITEVPDLLMDIVKNEPKILIRSEFDIRKQVILQSIVENEPTTVLKREKFTLDDEVFEISDESCDGDVKNDENDETVKIELNNKEYDFKNNECESNNENYYESNHNDIDECNSNNDNNDYECKTDYIEYNDIDNSKTIKERLKFEDDFDTELIKDLTNPCKVNLELIEDNLFDGNRNGYNAHDGMVEDTSMSGNVETAEEYKCVPYEELVETGVYSCKKCIKQFPNRYQAIIHETSHLNFRRKKLPFFCHICDWYISSSPYDLRKHKLTAHPDVVRKTYSSKKCLDCGLLYVKLFRHRLNYHKEIRCYFSRCRAVFGSLSELSNHCLCKHEMTIEDVSNDSDVEVKSRSDAATRPANEWTVKVIRLCDMCNLFLKKRINRISKNIGEFSVPGQRHPCLRCHKKFFSLNIIHLQTKRDLTHHFEVPVAPSRKKALSNVDRLKKVQKRLQQIKKLNKF